MFSIKSHTELSSAVTQPLIIINTQTFHIPINLKELSKFTQGEDVEMYTIKDTTHENQSDTVHVIGYWLNIFMRKIDKTLGTRINNALIMRFLEKHVGFGVPTQANIFVEEQSDYVVEDTSISGVKNSPKKIPKIW